MLGILGAGNTKSFLICVIILQSIAVYSVVVSCIRQGWKNSINIDNDFWETILFCSAGYVAYFIAACVLDFQRATALVVLTILAVAAKSFELLKEYKGKSITQCFRPAVKCFKSNLKWIKW